MSQFIQYQDKNGIWSDWVAANIDTQRNQITINHELIQSSYIRVLDIHGCKVCWYAWYQGFLYLIDKNNVGYISKAKPFNLALKSISTEAISNDFTLNAYNDMLESAQDFLKPSLFTAEDIQTLLLRPADEAKIIQLTENTSNTIEWWSQLFEKYRKNIEQKLLNIVENHTYRKQQNHALTEFLKQNYRFVQGTCLDYVAQPQHITTKALVHIAEKISEVENIDAIKLLMPDIAFESHQDKYPNLNSLSLSEVLSTHHAMDNNFLLPIQILTDFMNDTNEVFYSPYSKDGYYQKASENDILGLFKHSEDTISLYDIFQKYTTLTHNQDTLLGQLQLLVHQLKIYDAHGAGQENNAAGGAYPAILNFFDYYRQLEACFFYKSIKKPSINDLPDNYQLGYALFNHQIYFLNRREKNIHVLTHPHQSAKFPIHIAITEDITEIEKPAIIQTSEGYLFLQQNDSSLMLSANVIEGIKHLFQIHPIQLNEALIPNTLIESIPAHQTIEELISQRICSSKELSNEELIFIEVQTGHSFMSGYTHVPEPLRNEIQLLWDVFYNPQKNINATRNMTTCIATRGTKIKDYIKQFQLELVSIGLNAEKQHQLLKNTQQQLEHQMNIIQQKNYQGCDGHLNLNCKILEELQHVFRVSDFSSLQLLNQFHPDDLQIIFDTNHQLANDIIEKIGQNESFVENFIIYLIETPITALKVILPKVYQYILEGQRKRILSIFKHIDLDIEKTSLIATIFIKNAQEFTNLLHQSTPEFCIEIYQSFKEKIPEIIKSAIDFHCIFTSLSLEQRSEIFDRIKHKIIYLIQNSKNFCSIFHCLSIVQRSAIFDQIKFSLPLMIEKPGDFNLILSYLNAQQCLSIYEVVKNKLPKMIKTTNDFKRILEHLTPTQRLSIYYHFQNKIPEMIKSAGDFNNILSFLEPHICSEVYQKIKKDLPDMIDSNCDLAYIIYFLKREECLEVCLGIEQRILALITRPQDFKGILILLNHEKIQMLCEFINQKFPLFLQTAEQLHQILHELTIEQLNIVFLSFKNRLPDIIKTNEDFKYFFSNRDYLNSNLINIFILAVCEKYLDNLQNDGKENIPDEKIQLLNNIIQLLNSNNFADALKLLIDHHNNMLLQPTYPWLIKLTQNALSIQNQELQQFMLHLAGATSENYSYKLNFFCSLNEYNSLDARPRRNHYH